MTPIETLPLFGEPDRPLVIAPPAVPVRWSSYHPTNRVQCAQCVQLVHAHRGAGPVDIRTARRRRVSPNGELLLCAQHAEIKHAEDVKARLVPGPKRPGRRTA
jgi:hypothetical protein